MKAPRAIVIVSPGGRSRGGGIGSVTRAIEAWLAEHAPGTRVLVVDPWGARARWLWPARLVVAGLALIWLRASTGAEILHLHVSEGGSFLRKGLLLRLGRLLGMRVVLHHHGARIEPFVRGSEGPIRTFVAQTVRLADLNLVLGERTRRLLMEELAVPADKVAVLRNACADRGLARRHARGGMRLLVPAALSQRKGTEVVLEAIALLIKRGMAASATLAGEGPQDVYRHLAGELGIGAQVHFAGWLAPERLFELHRRSDALVLASRQEGMPMAIIEALAAGLPVIATPVGIIPETLRDGESALLVPPGEPVALADAMERLARDPALALRLARGGRQLYERTYDMDRYMRRLLALYGQLVAGVERTAEGLPAGEARGDHQIGEQ